MLTNAVLEIPPFGILFVDNMSFSILGNIYTCELRHGGKKSALHERAVDACRKILVIAQATEPEIPEFETTNLARLSQHVETSSLCQTIVEDMTRPWKYNHLVFFDPLKKRTQFSPLNTAQNAETAVVSEQNARQGEMVQSD